MPEVLLIIIFALLFLCIAWWKLDWAMVVTVLYLPAYLIRFDIGPLPSTMLEVMIGSVFLVWLVQTFFVQIGTWTAKCQSIWWPWRWLTLFFVLSGGLAVIISPDTRAALGLWKAYILEPAIFFVVFVNVIKTKQQIREVLWALGGITVIIGFVSLLQYLGIMDIPAHYGLETPKRATGVFPFPTAVGKFVGPVMGLFLGVLMVNGLKSTHTLFKWAREHIFVVGVLLFGSIGLLFSVSRGAMLGVFVSILFISFFSQWKKWIWMGLISVVLLAMLIPQTRDNITGVFSATDVSTDVRLVMWKGAARIIQGNLILGTGLASFPLVYEDYKEVSHTEYFPNPDHLILTLWIEMGLAGLLLFIWLVVAFFKASIRALQVDRAIAVGLMAAMVVIIVHGFLDTPYFKNDLAIQFWALVGMAVVMTRIKPQEELK